MGTSALSRSILDLRTLSSRMSVSAEKSENLPLPTVVSFPARVYFIEHQDTVQSDVISSIGVPSSALGIEP